MAFILWRWIIKVSLPIICLLYTSLEDADGEPGVRSLDEDNRVLNEGDTVSMEKLMGLMKKQMCIRDSACSR